MASASIRGLRSKSSRFSSPAISTEKDADDKQQDVLGEKSSSRTFMDRWVEPPMRNPAPSFEDSRGLERVGVLEYMAPLGQAPTQKMLQKLKLGSLRQALRTSVGQQEELVTPSTEIERMDLTSPADLGMRSESFQPEQVVSALNTRHLQQHNRLSRPLNGEASPGSNATPSPRKDIFAPSDFGSPQTSSSPTTKSLAQSQLQAQVDFAIREAERSGQSQLAPGLQRLHEDALSEPELVSVLEAILRNRPSQPQFRIFKRYIKYGIKKFTNPDDPEVLNVDLRPKSQDRAHGSLLFPGNSISAAHLSTVSSPIRLKPSPSHRHRHNSSSKTSHLSSKMSAEALRTIGARAGVYASPRRHRSRSVSSSSSLSSAKSIPESFATPLEGESAAHVDGHRTGRTAGPRQAANRVAAGNRTRASATMPLPPSSKHPFSDFKTASQFASKKFKKSKEDLNIDHAEVEKRRRSFEQQSFLNYNDITRPYSDERMAVTAVERPRSRLALRVPPPVVHPHPLDPSSAGLSSPFSIADHTHSSTVNGTRRKRGHHEMELDDNDIHTPMSSSPGPSLVPPPPGPAGSRAVTPRAAKIPPPGKARKSARVMISPNKPKNGGITAGIARAGPGRDSVIGTGAESSAEDNDEYCASCGGEGTLLCCDGCPNSFHHSCLEPPLDPDEEVDGEWFCPRCNARRNKAPISSSGLLGPLVRRVDDAIPKAFTLPFEVRDYFEGVKTGEEGEYEEVGLPRTQNNAVRMNRSGFIEEPNYKELRDSKNNLITCYRCGLTSQGRRDIIPCDYCPAKWHLDCMDPPLAVPPRRRVGDKPNASWRCPLHADHDLSSIGRAELAAPGDIGRAPRLRRPKNAVPYDVKLARGFKNNGIIDVELMKDEDNQINEVEMDGKMYRLPERGIRLDFIDRVKRSWYEDQTFPAQMQAPKRIREAIYRPSPPRRPSAVEQTVHHEQVFNSQTERLRIEAQANAEAVLRRKTLREQQAVLNLAYLSGKPAPTDALTQLTDQLILNAPPRVNEMADQSEKAMLERLLGLVQNRLRALGSTKGAGRAAPVLVNGESSKDGKRHGADENGSDQESEMDISS